MTLTRSGTALVGTSLLALAVSTGMAFAQQGGGGGGGQPPAPTPYVVGNPIGLPAAPSPANPNAAAFAPMSDNVRVFGGFRFAEACTYDPAMDLIVVSNQGIGQNLTPNDGWITLINHDGSVHTPKWIGVQGANQRANLDPPLVLNQPFGVDIVNGTLYAADRDGGLADPAGGSNTPSVATIAMFDMATGMPTGRIAVPESTGFNDIAVTADGTIYATQTGGGGQEPDPTTWRVFRIMPDGTASVFAEGAPMRQPNGIAIDPDGNIVVVNIGTADVITYAPDGSVLATTQAAMAGNDGLVIMPDGTMYVSSVTMGGVSMIPPGGTAELIATGIPSAASMCYDAGANQLAIPMNNVNAIALVPLD